MWSGGIAPWSLKLCNEKMVRNRLLPLGALPPVKETLVWAPESVWTAWKRNIFLHLSRTESRFPGRHVCSITPHSAIPANTQHRPNFTIRSPVCQWPTPLIASLVNCIYCHSRMLWCDGHLMKQRGRHHKDNEE